ncbi:MAG: TMEM175 family protein [Candidatus Tumulicola sp.]
MIPKDSTVGADAERTLHRLEAFSDIVIGFCIAEMGINLLVPQHVPDVRAIVTAITGFSVSFVLISFVWWFHHRIFSTYFVLTRITLILNFTLLGSLVLMVYVQQIALHFIAMDSNPTNVVRMWMAGYGVVYSLLGAMLWIGLRTRWKALNLADLRWGVSRASLLSVGATIFFLCAAGLAGVQARSILIGGPIAVLIMRVFIPKFVDRVITGHT